jgi:SAM-dependent methyltransferase
MQLDEFILRIFSKFFDIECYSNKSLILDKEVSFLPVYTEFVEHVAIEDPPDREVLRRLPQYLTALQKSRTRLAHRRSVDRLRNVVKPQKGKKILDIGCQFGTNLLELAGFGAEAYGVDLVVPYISVLKKRCKCLGIEVYPVVADAAMLPFKEGCFDAVMSREFVSHVADLENALHEMFRITKDKVILVDTNMVGLGGVRLLLKKEMGLRWLFTKGKLHTNKYLGRQKDENIHSSFWWKRKLGAYAGDAKIASILPFDDSRTGRLLGFIYKYFGEQMLVIACKQRCTRGHVARASTGEN